MRLVRMGENHGTCEDTGKQHGRIPQYMGSGMYEKCGSELERPYLSPKGKDEVAYFRMQRKRPAVIPNEASDITSNCLKMTV